MSDPKKMSFIVKFNTFVLLSLFAWLAALGLGIIVSALWKAFMIGFNTL